MFKNVQCVRITTSHLIHFWTHFILWWRYLMCYKVNYLMFSNDVCLQWHWFFSPFSSVYIQGKERIYSLSLGAFLSLQKHNYNYNVTPPFHGVVTWLLPLTQVSTSMSTVSISLDWTYTSSSWWHLMVSMSVTGKLPASFSSSVTESCTVAWPVIIIVQNGNTI